MTIADIVLIGLLPTVLTLKIGEWVWLRLQLWILTRKVNGVFEENRRLMREIRQRQLQINNLHQ